MSTFRRVLSEEINFKHTRFQIAKFLALPLPLYTAGRLRAQIIRIIVGFEIGRGTMIFGMPTFSGIGNIYKNLIVGEHTLINVSCFLDLVAPIIIGSYVAIGPEAMLLTGTHEIGETERRATKKIINKPVHIGDGSWLGARCVIYPGVTIGEGAIVSAGAIVYKDVPPNTMVGGNPARVLQKLGD
jgi:acetyltransferase-like isoleucine patch superfamily enzyme